MGGPFRKIDLVAGADAGGERAATFYTLIQTAKLNGLEPHGYLEGSRGYGPPKSR